MNPQGKKLTNNFLYHNDILEIVIYKFQQNFQRDVERHIWTIDNLSMSIQWSSSSWLFVVHICIYMALKRDVQDVFLVWMGLRIDGMSYYIFMFYKKVFNACQEFLYYATQYSQINILSLC